MNSLEPLIHRKVVVLFQDAPARQAAIAMCKKEIGCVLVCDQQGGLTGIVTDRDLTCSVLAVSEDPLIPISEIMTPMPVSLDENVDVADVAHTMEESGIRRIPITHKTEKGILKCVGIVTLDDLIAARLIDRETIARVIQSQIRRRKVNTSYNEQSEKAGDRSDAHMDQTLNIFYKIVGGHTQLSHDNAQQLTQTVLELIIRRLHFNTANNFIAQLPKRLQEHLLDLPAGPDRRIDLSWILSRLYQKHGLNENRGRIILRQFCYALSQLVNPAEIENIKSQLPPDLARFFDFDEREVG